MNILSVLIHRRGAENAEKNYSSKPSTSLLIPCFSTGTLKFMSNPNFHPPSFKYVKSCASCMGRRTSTAFTSTTTVPATNKSMRYPHPSLNPLYSKGKRFLTFKRNISYCKFSAKTFLVSRL